MNAPAAMATVGRNAFYYTLASVIARVASLLLLPVYTRYLTPADYGVMELLGLAVDVAAILFVSGMNSGMQRFYFEEENERSRGRVVSTTFWLEIGLALIATVALWLAAPLAPLVGLRAPEHVHLLRVAASTFFFGVMSSVPMLLLQSTNRAFTFLILAIVKLGSQIALNLYFLVHVKLGVASMLYTGLIVNILLGVGLALWMARSVGLAVSREILRKLRRFGVPYQITVAGSFILVFGDRFILGAHATNATVGLYGIAYQFGFLFGALGEVPFIRAWNPIRYALMKSSPRERDAAYNQGLLTYSVLLSCMAIGIIAFAPVALRLMTTEAFRPAGRLVPIIVAAYLVQAYTMAVVFGIDAATKTKYFTYATWTSAIVSLSLYLVLIPPFGGFGAAWATLVAFLVRFGMTYRFAQRLWPVSYEWGSVLRGTGIVLLVWVGVWAAPPSSGLTEVGTALVLTLSGFGALWALALRANERVLVRQFFARVIVTRLRWRTAKSA